MKEKERTVTHPSSSIVFYLIAAVIIVSSFVLFVPKISSDLFPFKRQLLWNTFLTQTKKEQQLDARHFWELREFYSSGYFTRHLTASPQEIATASKPFGNIQTTNLTTLIQFTSAQITSIDSLTTASQLSQILVPFPKEHIVYQDKNAVIYEQDSKHVIISFVRSNEEMRKTNGFYDYADKDKKLVENKYWFNITRITLP